VPQIEHFYIQLGELLRGAREKAGISQDQLGARLTPRMTRASIANMESGKQRVLAKTLVDLASALDISITSLIPGHQPREASSRANLRAELGAALDLPPDKLKELTRKIEEARKGEK
jgi:transcriptional regulator with XRE-family HTH domain